PRRCQMVRTTATPRRCQVVRTTATLPSLRPGRMLEMTASPMTASRTTGSRVTAAPMTVWSHVLREHRRGLVGWSLSVAVVTAIYVAVYPSFGGGAMDEMIANLPEAMVQALGYDEMS